MQNQENQGVISRFELAILKSLIVPEAQEKTSLCREVTEIAHIIGMHDKDEIIRALYSLEGKSLVSPEPEGDFTSSFWKITDTGIKAIKLLISKNSEETYQTQR